MLDKKTNNHSAKNVVLVAVMAATILAGKIALAFLPNIEIVTLLCALYGYVFGPLGLAATLVFIMCDAAVWGFGSWIISYFIYWPLVCCVYLILSKCKIKNRVIITAVAVILTAFFGVLTSLIDVGLFMGVYDNFWMRFSIYYMRGIAFFAVHITCNIACFLFVFFPLQRVLLKYKNKSTL